MHLLNAVHSKATISMREKRLFMDHGWHKNRLQLSEHSFYSTLSQMAQADKSNHLQWHYYCNTKNPIPPRHISASTGCRVPLLGSTSLNFLVQRRVVGTTQTPAPWQGCCSPELCDSTCQYGHFCMKLISWGKLGLLWWQLSLMHLTALFSNRRTSAHPLWLLDLQLHYKLYMLGHFQYRQQCLICRYRSGSWFPNREVCANHSTLCFMLFTDSKRMMVLWTHVK